MRSQALSVLATDLRMGSSFLHTGQVGDRKNSSWLCCPRSPTVMRRPSRSGSAKRGAASPTAGPLSIVSAPIGATRSYSTPI
ncbi:hypothetical protein G6F68_020840 [Rhizopus microsporus]|nr:hypothetical protein G6F68_020840 [Rhizopus microsporus]